MNMETKARSGRITETKQEERNGIPVGLISGYIATYDVDRGNDQFAKGAFLESIQEHQNKRRQIRFKDHHWKTIGGFPIETVREDEKGLFGIAEVNLTVQDGREAFALAKQGVLSNFSIGYSSLDDEFKDGVRIIKKAIIWEGSIVDEPMNPNANITEIKSLGFQDLPIAASGKGWDEERALKNINKARFPNPDFEKAHILLDNKHPTKYHRFLIADIVDGKLMVIPEAVHKAARDVKEDMELSEESKKAAIQHLEKYYAKMNVESPFKEDKQYFLIDDVKDMSPRDLEKTLRKSGCFSKDAAALIAAKHKTGTEVKQYTLDEARLLLSLKGF